MSSCPRTIYHNKQWFCVFSLASFSLLNSSPFSSSIIASIPHNRLIVRVNLKIFGKQIWSLSNDWRLFWAQLLSGSQLLSFFNGFGFTRTELYVNWWSDQKLIASSSSSISSEDTWPWSGSSRFDVTGRVPHISLVYYQDGGQRGSKKWDSSGTWTNKYSKIEILMHWS